jgi:hypothetical protein
MDGRRLGDTGIPLDAEGGLDRVSCIDAVKLFDPIYAFDSTKRGEATIFVAAIVLDADHWLDALNDRVGGLYR